MEGWKKKRVLLYAHGGLVPEETAIQRVADYREAMLAQQIYPLCFIWKTDFWTTLGNILKDAARPRSEGLIERSEEHTSELQSLMRISYAVFCLKKKKYPKHTINNTHDMQT